MGDGIHFTRLRWSGHGGIAKLHGRTVVLVVPPVILGQPVHAIDYVPADGFKDIQPTCLVPRRDMTPAEVRDADALLRLLVPTT